MVVIAQVTINNLHNKKRYILKYTPSKNQKGSAQNSVQSLHIIYNINQRVFLQGDPCKYDRIPRIFPHQEHRESSA